MQPYPKQSSPDQGASFMSFCFYSTISERISELDHFQGGKRCFLRANPMRSRVLSGRLGRKQRNHYQVPGNSCRRRSSLSLKYHKYCLVVTKTPTKNLHLSATRFEGITVFCRLCRKCMARRSVFLSRCRSIESRRRRLRTPAFLKLSASLQSIIWCLKKGY
ncbi:hypothetical protein Naga_100395g4 [Nannochloropsis gaditana]|uniref:Uncharacterized protein n=1 Tax=Nannochloropsis gaditana TaxID=72520 RepID=W7TK26_9STRA|nr:hypothetical protein Naga_100395g4 [Nannochloropsis gaditana]